MSKERIGIVPGKMDNAAYELMLRLFKDETMKDLLTPVIYGRKETSEQAMEHALKAWEEDEVDVIVTGMRDIKIGDMRLLMNEHTRLAICDKLPLKEHLQKLLLCIRRDFLISEVRIALVGIEPTDEEKEGVPAYGPFTEETLLKDNNWTHYDVILAKDKESVAKIIDLIQQSGLWYDAENETIITSPTRVPHWDAEGKELEDCQSIMGATFIATDINRNRQAYDEANENPLPKLFMDRREERRNPVNFRVPVQ